MAINLEKPIKIEHGVPIPKGTATGGRSRYPFAAMKVGDSFKVEVMAKGKDAAKKTQKALLKAAGAFKKRTKASGKFLTRQIDDGKAVRIWLTK